jgi:FkbM family methyltransferase
MSSSPFEHYNTCFDAGALLERFSAKKLFAQKQLITNFLGVVIRPTYLPGILSGRESTVEPIPVPANWHADIAEWGAVLRAVDLAPGPGFVMGELGCGWGCWMANSGVVARSRGLTPILFGIEGDEGHCRFAEDCMSINGFQEDQYKVLRGVAACGSGRALFPKQERSGLSWGLEPIFGASAGELDRARKEGSHDIVEMVPLSQMFAKQQRVDLLHIDIQGGELDLIRSSIDFLTTSVAYIVIGTHSRSIEGALIDQMVDAGWLLEMERPAIFNLPLNGIASTTVDGVQGWRNPRLLPPQSEEVRKANRASLKAKLKSLVKRFGLRRR